MLSYYNNYCSTPVDNPTQYQWPSYASGPQPMTGNVFNFPVPNPPQPGFNQPPALDYYLDASPIYPISSQQPQSAGLPTPPFDSPGFTSHSCPEPVFRFQAKKPLLVAKEVVVKHQTRERERNRAKQVNAAFDTLQGKVPAARDVRKLPKIKTLRLAMQYIQYLKDLLQADDAPNDSNVAVPSHDAFLLAAKQEIITKNTYVKRARIMLEEQQQEPHTTGQVSPPSDSYPFAFAAHPSIPTSFNFAHSMCHCS